MINRHLHVHVHKQILNRLVTCTGVSDVHVTDIIFVQDKTPRCLLMSAKKVKQKCS